MLNAALSQMAGFSWHIGTGDGRRHLIYLCQASLAVVFVRSCSTDNHKTPGCLPGSTCCSWATQVSICHLGLVCFSWNEPRTNLYRRRYTNYFSDWPSTMKTDSERFHVMGFLRVCICFLWSCPGVSPGGPGERPNLGATNISGRILFCYFWISGIQGCLETTSPPPSTCTCPKT